MVPTRSILLCLTSTVLACSGSDLDRRQADVAAVGGTVMPFDLDRTTHVFEKAAAGGVQTVLSDDGDPAQIAAVRAHLREEASRFARGDFHDPEMIHGADMAGLQALVMGYERLSIAFEELEGGGRIAYESDDTSLVAAIHQWFDAQLRDHGDHAVAHR